MSIEEKKIDDNRSKDDNPFDAIAKIFQIDKPNLTLDAESLSPDDPFVEIYNVFNSK